MRSLFCSVLLTSWGKRPSAIVRLCEKYTQNVVFFKSNSKIMHFNKAVSLWVNVYVFSELLYECMYEHVCVCVCMCVCVCVRASM